MGRYKGPEAPRFGPRRGAHARLAGVPGTWRGETADRGARGAGNLETNWGCALRSRHSLQGSPGEACGSEPPSQASSDGTQPSGRPGAKALLGGFAWGGGVPKVWRGAACVCSCALGRTMLLVALWGRSCGSSSPRVGILGVAVEKFRDPKANRGLSRRGQAGYFEATLGAPFPYPLPTPWDRLLLLLGRKFQGSWRDLRCGFPKGQGDPHCSGPGGVEDSVSAPFCAILAPR